MKDNKIKIEKAKLEHPGNEVGSSNGFSIVDCQVCGYKHAIPVPTFDELKEVYSHEYYTIEKPLYIERYLEDKEWWDNVYADRYRILEKNLNHNRRKILDIGSGPGLFLHKGKERGWKVKGIEPSEQAAAYSRDVLGLDISEEFLDKNSAAKMEKFDAVNLGEVLEHIPDPLEMLKLVNDLLEDEGLVCIIVPNDFNPFQLLLRDHMNFEPWWIAPPHHINYFDFNSLATLVTKAGFKVIHQESTFPIDIFLLMGDNYVGNDDVGRKVHNKRKLFDTSLSANTKLRQLIAEKFAEIDIGREIVMIGRKISREKS
jgi:SAM-dependent methyltransferase